MFTKKHFGSISHLLIAVLAISLLLSACYPVALYYYTG